jgi:adenylate cyclase
MCSTDKTLIVIGRLNPDRPCDLDLSPDDAVSRSHARLWLEQGQYWIEDLNSRCGTKVNGAEIKEQGKKQLQPDDVILIGQTILQLPDLKRISQEREAASAHPERQNDREPVMASFADDTRPSIASADNTAGLALDALRLKLIYDLSSDTAIPSNIISYLEALIERIVKGVPRAARGAFLFADGRLMAHYPPGSRPSLTLALQAITEQRALTWSKGNPAPTEGALPESVLPIQSAMYAPLVWGGKSLGVVCVDNPQTSAVFSDDDLALLKAVARVASSVLAHVQLKEQLSQREEVLNNFKRIVSAPAIERLGKPGRIRPGGEFLNVTVLFSDIRGFTKMSSNMRADDVTEMLEEYFGRMVPIISKHQGTVDKYVGDAILAVFANPEENSKQHFQAVEAALEMQSEMQRINQERSQRGHSTGELGIGIHCGTVVQGFIGSRERLEFTVIGDVVNQASRYCDGAAKGEILLSPEVHQVVWKAFEWIKTEIPTKHEGPLTAYRIVKN